NRMMSRGLNMVALSFACFAGTTWADGSSPVKPFDATGLVVDVQDLFPVAARDGKKADRGRGQPTLNEVAGRALVTYLQYGDGKTAFLGNGTHFKNVEVKAQVFPGQFLLVDGGKLLP
ncbi:MAG: hypothetical protein WA746_13975, partial [Isosphaeraceae bacterium]